jgi:hypothetical protein
MKTLRIVLRAMFALFALTAAGVANVPDKEARDNPEERGEEHPQGTRGQSFDRTHPVAYSLTVGPLAIMVGIIVLAALAVFTVLVSMGE